MSWLIVALFLIAGVGLFLGSGFVIDTRPANVMAVTGLILAFGCILALLAMTSRTAMRSWDETRCEDFGLAADQTTQFIDYTYWNWDCLVRVDGFGWVPLDSLRNTP